MAKRRTWDPASYPRPRKWRRGFVSRAQHRKFATTPRLRKFYNGMMSNTPGGTHRANAASRRSKLRRLPLRVTRRRRRR